MGKTDMSTSLDISGPEQKASGDFYGQYFWKDYDVQDAGFLEFIVSHVDHERLMSAETLLDIGAGSGKYAILLKRAYPHLRIAALDFSADNVATMVTNADAAGVDIAVTEGSALDLPYDDNAFDIVLCVYMLQHTPDPRQGFLEAARVAAPGGTVLYAIGRENGMGKLHSKSRNLFGRVPASLRRPSVLPFVPLYWSLLKATGRRKASENDLTIDLVDWLYNPLQKFVLEADILSWFDQAGLTYSSLGYTGLMKSMHICRGTKQTGSNK
jgi:ubiquinone/menaquinone biosynthesis C-methylase UbiE